MHDLGHIDSGIVNINPESVAAIVRFVAAQFNPSPQTCDKSHNYTHASR